MAQLPSWVTRWLGMRSQPPPPQPTWISLLWAFVGAFCGLSVLQAIFAHDSYFTDRGVPQLVASYVWFSPNTPQPTLNIVPQTHPTGCNSLEGGRFKVWSRGISKASNDTMANTEGKRTTGRFSRTYLRCTRITFSTAKGCPRWPLHQCARGIDHSRYLSGIWTRKQRR